MADLAMEHPTEEKPVEVAPAVDETAKEETIPETSESEVEAVKEPEKSSTTSPPAKKESVPPKRPLTAGKRLSVAPSSATKTTPTAASKASASSLSKPPTRPPPGSTVRRPAVAGAPPVSAPSHRSQPSTSSTDGEKKGLGGAARRVSLAPAASTRSPAAKSASTADRRSTITPSTSTIRKSATSSASPAKTVSKPGPSSTSTTASRAPASSTTRSTVSATKTAASNVVADAKKRLSTITASPAPRTGAARGTTATSASTSKDTSALESKIKELEAEIATLKSGQAVNGESTANAEQLEELKTKYETSETESTSLREQLAATQSKLAELGAATAKESENVTLAEANIRNAHEKEVAHLRESFDGEMQAKHAEAEKSRSEHAASLASLQKDVKAEKDSSAATTAKIAELTAALATVKEALQKAEHKANTTSVEHKKALENRDIEIKGMGQVVDNLKNELQKVHETKDQELNTKVSGLNSQHEKTVADLNKSMAATHAKNIKDTQEGSSKTIAALETKIKTLEDQAVKEKKSKAETDSALKSAQQELAGLKKSLETLDQDNSGKDQQHASTIAKLKADLDATTKSHDAKSKEISTIKERHMNELQSLNKDHEAEFEALEGTLENKQKEKLKELQGTNDSLVKSQEEKDKTHATAIGTLKKDHASALETLRSQQASSAKSAGDSQKHHAAEIEALKIDHGKGLKQQQSDLEVAHGKKIAEAQAANATNAKALEISKSSHVKDLALAKDTHSKELAATKDAHAKEISTHKSSLEALMIEHTKTTEKHKAEISTLNKQHEEARTAHATEIAKAKTTTPDTSALQSKHKAEVTTLQTSQARDKETISTLTAELSKAQAGASKPSDTAALEKELEEHKAKLKSSQETSARDVQDLNQVFTTQVETLQKESDALNESNKALKDELAKSKLHNDSLAAQVKAGKGLGKSKWADNDPTTAEGEDTTSSVNTAGTMASLRKQIDSLKQVNEGLKEESARMVKELSMPTL